MDLVLPPLDGVRVLDFGRYIAGPYCARLLGDVGAEVIRVEKVRGSEDRFVVPLAHGDAGAMFLQMNENKRGMTLDPTKPEATEIVRRLVASSDVVVANLPAAALAAIGLDYGSLTSIKSDIILTSVDAFGGGGPWSERPGFDGIGQVMSGAAYLSGERDVPSKSYMLWVDFGTASFAAFGTMAALMTRAATGKGQHVQGALLKTALTVANSTLMEQAILEPDRVATGNRGQIAGPADIFETSDGWIIVQVIGNGLFKRWLDLVGEDQWHDDERFSDDESRGNHRDILCDRMSAWSAQRSTAGALEALEKAGLPSAPVLSPRQALVNEHVAALGFLRPVDYPGVPRPAPVADTPVSLSAVADRKRTRAPLLGEHTDEILAEIGFGPAEIDAFRNMRVI